MACSLYVTLPEAPDPLAGRRRQLGRVHRARHGRHYLQALAADDLDHPRQVDLTQLDRGACQRAHRGCRTDNGTDDALTECVITIVTHLRYHEIKL